MSYGHIGICKMGICHMGIQYVIWSYGHIIIAWWVGMLKTAKIQPEIQRVKFNPIERAVKYVDVKMKRTKWPPLNVSENSFPKWSKCPFFNVLCEQENSDFCSFFGSIQHDKG